MARPFSSLLLLTSTLPHGTCTKYKQACVLPSRLQVPLPRRVLLSHVFSHFSGVNRTCPYVTTPTINRTAVKPINHDISKRTFGVNPVP